MAGYREVIPGLYQVHLLGADAFVVVEEEIAAIDAGWAGSQGRVLRLVERLGRSSREIGHLVATHYHVDHVGAMARLREASSGRVAAHEVEAPIMSWEQRPPNPFVHPALAFLTQPLAALSLLTPPAVTVDMRLRDGDRLPILGGLQVVHTPGHTPGSISLYAAQHGLLIAGDALEYRFGRLGPPNPLFSVDMALAKASIRRLAGLDIEVICFSHFRPMLSGGGRALRALAESLA